MYMGQEETIPLVYTLVGVTSSIWMGGGCSSGSGDSKGLLRFVSDPVMSDPSIDEVSPFFVLISVSFKEFSLLVHSSSLDESSPSSKSSGGDNMSHVHSILHVHKLMW